MLVVYFGRKDVLRSANAEEDTNTRLVKNVVLRTLWSASSLAFVNADLKFEGCVMSIEC